MVALPGQIAKAFPTHNRHTPFLAKALMEEHLKAELRGLSVHDLHEEPGAVWLKTHGLKNACWIVETMDSWIEMGLIREIWPGYHQ